MSVKKNSSLRNALREMRVSEPQRLPKSGPSFKPPVETPAPIGKEVPSYEAPPPEASRIEVAENVVPQSERPQNEKAQIEVAQTKAPQSELPQNEQTPFENSRNELPQTEAPAAETAQYEPPRNEGAQKEGSQAEPPQSEKAHNGQPRLEQPRTEVAQLHHPQNELPRKKEARAERPQNEAAGAAEVAQIELPQIEQPSRGFFRLSDRAFSYPQLQQLSGDCFRLFLWMSFRGWRYQNSDGTVRASVGFIEDHTAMSHATISRCLKTLREERLIELLETDYKRGNVWGISPVAFAGCDPENLPPRSGGPQNEGPRKEAAAASKRDRSHLNLRDKPPQNEEQIRNIYKSKKLSQEGAQALLDRIEKIRAPEKQKTEREGLIQLLETYQPTELETALAYVERYGTLSGEGCHSPFRYLTVAVDDVLQACRKKGFAVVPKLNVSEAAVEVVPQRNQQQEADHSRNAFTAFQSQLSIEERAKFVEQYVAKEFAWGYKPSDDLAIRLAAVNWFEKRETLQRAI